MVGSGCLEISRRVQGHKPASLRDQQVKQARKWDLVIRWFCMEGPSLNG